MHLKMNTGLSGPCYCLGPGEEIPFDETFPFAARELRRHIDAGHCSYVGKPEDLDAWIAANPDPEPAVEAEPEAPASETPPVTEPAAAPVSEVVTEAPPVEPAVEAEAAPKARAKAAAKK